jgi:hypothetical protein
VVSFSIIQSSGWHVLDRRDHRSAAGAQQFPNPAVNGDTPVFPFLACILQMCIQPFIERADGLPDVADDVGPARVCEAVDRTDAILLLQARSLPAGADSAGLRSGARPYDSFHQHAESPKFFGQLRDGIADFERGCNVFRGAHPISPISVITREWSLRERARSSAQRSSIFARPTTAAPSSG